MPDDEDKASVLRDAAVAMVANDPDRAESLARSITQEPLRVSALIGVAAVVATSDPARAALVFNDAERIAQSIADEADKELACFDVLEALAAVDPDRAERFARSIDDDEGGWYLNVVAKTLAAVDPGRAERIARSITQPAARMESLLEIANRLSG
jgi:hypothetical protein